MWWLPAALRGCVRAARVAWSGPLACAVSPRVQRLPRFSLAPNAFPRVGIGEAVGSLPGRGEKCCRRPRRETATRSW